MSKIQITRIRLLRSTVGGHLSFLVTLPGDVLIEADLRPSTAARLLTDFDLVEAPDEEQNFATARVITLEKKKEVDRG